MNSRQFLAAASAAGVSFADVKTDTGKLLIVQRPGNEMIDWRRKR